MAVAGCILGRALTFDRGFAYHKKNGYVGLLYTIVRETSCCVPSS
jgi:hypothetical protein